MEQTQCDGFRLDAVKHIPAWFYKDGSNAYKKLQPKAAVYCGRVLVVHEVDKLQTYIDQVEGKPCCSMHRCR